MVVPLGLKVSTAALLRALDMVLPHMNFVLKFLDDLLCVSQNFTSYLKHLEKLFKRLIKYNITLNFEKTHFCQEEAKFLGHILSETHKNWKKFD